MKILMVCAEFAPWAKTGGLADAVAGLSDALCARGHDVRVLLPKYSHLAEAHGDSGTIDGVGGRYRWNEIEPEQKAQHPGRRTPKPRVLLLDLEELTADRIYTGDARDAGRFLRLSAAAAAFATAGRWRPQVIHCHDWHAALTPVLERTTTDARTPSVLTLHNVGYQGVFAGTVLREHGFATLERDIAPDARVGGTVNYLRAGLHAADRITTVSPTYAVEIQSSTFGMGLEDVLAARSSEVVGILNGVDYRIWSPTHDPFLAERYDATDLAPKRRLKGRLIERLGLSRDADAPQKGIDLVATAIPALLGETRVSFALLGSGDTELAAELRRLADAYPTRVSFTDGYDETLAHEIFAGCDLTLVPSRYEPCGLTQMYALRYGTIPVVRATGGLADTVQHYDPGTGSGTGSVFRDADVDGLLWGVRTALAWFDDRAAWSRLIANAMTADFSWEKQAPLYEEVYRSLM
jgi:starch synthase